MPRTQLSKHVPDAVETTANIREQNTLRVIETLTSRQSWSSLNALGKDIFLSRPTLNLVLNNLVKTGLVESKTADTGHALGGRKPQIFRINPTHHNTIVMRVNLSGCTGRVISADGETIFTHYLPYFANDFVDQTFATLLQELLKHATGPVAATVIAVMGIVSEGKLIRSDRFPTLTQPAWTKQLQTILKTAGHIPQLRIVNDAKVATQWMEHLLRNAGNQSETIVAIHCSDTVGAGLVFNGKLLEGTHGAAGEILLGKPTHWHRCADLLHKLAEKHGRPTNEILSTPGICSKEKPHLEAIIQEMGYALIPIINLLDPDVIAIGGAISDCGKLVKSQLAQILEENTPVPPEVFITPKGTQSVLSGCQLHAREMALQTLLA